MLPIEMAQLKFSQSDGCPSDSLEYTSNLAVLHRTLFHSRNFPPHHLKINLWESGGDDLDSENNQQSTWKGSEIDLKPKLE
jgi:hypothetical protein